MTAKQALKLSRIGAKRQARMARARMKDLKARKVKDFEKVNGYLSHALIAIEADASQGNYRTDCRGIDDEEIANRVAAKLRRKGFQVEVHSDTIFTGVDQWVDQFKLVIRWQPS